MRTEQVGAKKKKKKNRHVRLQTTAYTRDVAQRIRMIRRKHLCSRLFFRQ